MRRVSAQSMRMHGRSDSGVPVLRYFVFVGGTLLALMFVADAVLPDVPTNERFVSGTGLPSIRIYSDLKGPEQIVLDTSQPAAATARVDAATAPVALLSDSRIRETFAQAPPVKPAMRYRSSRLCGHRPIRQQMRACDPGHPGHDR